MFERPQLGNDAILVHVFFVDNAQQEDLDEFKELALAADANIVNVITGNRDAPDAKFFVGLGKAEEIRDAVALHKASLVIFNHKLSPAQERNLEKCLQCRVLDRTGLILDIFAQRAQSFEGKCQVELAQLQHLSTRLVRGWSHLERQKGGIGLRGPGETQLETDRRLLRLRIKHIHKRLQKVRKQRDQSRQARRKALLPTVALVGYTNAGKSTLFNRLTAADVYVADKLFATLDPTLRQLKLPGSGKVILADTVGFIRHLPHDLIEAFSATLEETRDASLLLHVIDIADPEREAHNKQVYEVLEQIDAHQIPILEVYNKIDAINDGEPTLFRDATGKPSRVTISAVKDRGIDLLIQAVREWVYGDPVQRTILLKPDQGQLRAVLYEMDAVLSERNDTDGNWLITFRMAKTDFFRLFPKDISEEIS